MVTALSGSVSGDGVAISREQAHGFPDAKPYEFVDATCEKCGKVFRVFVNWDYRDRPKHFYCSNDCYFSMLGKGKREDRASR